MEEIFDIAINYLYESGHPEDYEMFSNFAITEKIIPESYKSIKNYVLGHHKIVMVANAKIRLISIPIAKTLSYKVEPKIIEAYDTYFNDEYACLKIIQKLLKSKEREITEGIPMASGCGIIMRAIGYGHLENTNRLSTAINNCSDSYDNGFDIILPESITTPVNMQLVKRITPTINRQFYNKK